MAKLKQKTIIPNLVKTSGTTHRWKMNHLETVKEPDEENPKQTVTRLRRKNFISELLSRKIITEEQFRRGNQYAILCEKALGATQDLYAKVSLLSVSRKPWEHTQAQHEAYEKLFMIWEGMGKYNIMIVNMVTIGDLNASQMSKIIPHDRRTISGMIKLAFDSLENIFDKLEKTSCTM